MNELASVFLSVFSDESTAYWCFSNFMLYDTYSTSSLTLNTTMIAESHVLKTSVAHYFSDNGFSKKLAHLMDLLKQTDQELYNHFKAANINNLYFCHEWLILSFKRCFKTTHEYHRCFEMLASHFLELHTSALKSISIESLYSFDLFICLSIVQQMRLGLLECNNEMDLYEVLKDNTDLFSSNYELILKYAEDIFDKYCIKMKKTSYENIDLNIDSKSKRAFNFFRKNSS